MLITAVVLTILALGGMGLMFYNAQTIRTSKVFYVASFVAAAVLTSFTAAALAATAAAVVEPQTWWQSMLDGLLPHVVTVVVGVVALLASLLLQRLGITVKMQQLESFVGAGVGYAEQWAKNKLNNGGEPVAGEEKKRMAVDFILGLCATYKVGNYTRDFLENLVESKLGQIEQAAPTVIVADGPLGVEPHVTLPTS